MYLFVGDIGGTHTRLALAQLNGDNVSLLREKVYPSRDHHEPGELLKRFLGDIAGVDVSLGCLGVAGPVLHNRCASNTIICR